MLSISRRRALGTGLAAGALVALPRVGILRAEDRPSITVAVQQVVNTNTLSPLREQSNVGTRIMTNFVETLIELDLQGNLEQIPGLATTWRRLDERTVELELRQGVRFHNGDEMTADDVVFTFGTDHMFGPDGGVTSRPLFTGVIGGDSKELPPEVPAVARRIWPKLKRVEAIDRYTVRFTNREPDVTLEGRIARLGSNIVNRRAFEEAASWLDWARRPVGTGPYRVADFVPDTSLTLVAFDDYWGGRPPIRELRFLAVPEVSSRINGLLSGEYDFACDIPPDQIAQVEGDRFEVKGGLITNHRLLCFDKQHPELVDPRVRLALAHAIDRQLIVDALWAGRSRVPAGLQWEYYGEMFHADWTVPEYDPQRAQQLLREAGYQGGVIPFRVLNDYYTNQVATAQVLTEMWRQVGVNVEIQMRENWAQIFDRSSPRGLRDWSNSAPFGDPVSSIVNQHGPNGQQQQIGEWSNAEMNELSGRLESETDMARRKAVFRRMLEICEREDPAYTVLHQTATFTAKRRDLHWEPAPSFAMDMRARNFGLLGG